MKRNLILIILFFLLIIDTGFAGRKKIKIKRIIKQKENAYVLVKSEKMECEEGNCKDGEGTVIFKDGSSFTGEFQKGLFHGKGTYVFPVADLHNNEKINKRIYQGTKIVVFSYGVKYVGEFFYGTISGKGKIIWPNEYYYQGIFNNSRFVDTGTFHFPDDSAYEDKCTDGDCISDEGEKVWSHGRVYSGEFKDGKMHGEGTSTWAIGHKYTGTYENNAEHGKGTFFWADGSKYEGDFKFGKYNGKGIYTFADGRKYEGDFLDGNREGTGIFYLANDLPHYKGSWKNDKRNGYGTLYIYFSNGKIDKKYVGLFKNDKYAGSGIYYDFNINGKLSKKWDQTSRGKGILSEFFPNGERYVGKFEGGDMIGRGKGTHFMSDGSKYEGTFFNSEYDGTGTLYDSKGKKIYEGVWKRGKMEGKGTFYYPGNAKYTGSFINNKKEGYGIYFVLDQFNNVIYKFVGQFKNDRVHGKGTAYEFERSGSIIKETTGWWDGNKFLGK